MANPAKFNRDTVVSLACDLFWKKGFHATSTRDLQDAIDLRPGSIYAAFGNKQGLYTEALRHYANKMDDLLESCLEQHDSVIEGLKTFTKSALIDETEQQSCDQCMLIKATSEFKHEYPELKSLSESLLVEFETRLAQLFAQAIDAGELPKNGKAIDYARHFQIHFIGLRSYAARVTDKSLIDSLIEKMFDAVKA
ncbi:MAG: TetR family transcriptional regulator [Alteromonadaceae bacterium]|nr:MAG: TetR family transcriptional regulator [Alteromonadaceae bacterium]